MLKVLIAEDELVVRLGIKASVDWNKLGMEVVADAENGQAAWNAYLKYKPHIVVTDLRMPVMDGMELIRKIRADSPETKIIILSCVQDFELARKAISLGVSDYIPKLTMSRHDMEAVVRRVGSELAALPGAVPSPTATDAPPVTAETVLSEYLFSGGLGEDDFARRIQTLDPHFQPRNLVLCVMEIDHFSDFQKRLGSSQEQPVRVSVENLVRRILAGYRVALFARCGEARFVLVFSFADSREVTGIEKATDDTLQHVQRAMKSYFDASVSFGKSPIRQGYSSLRAIYRDAVGALELKYFLGTGGTVASDGVDDDRVRQALQSGLAGLIDGLRRSSDLLANALEGEVDTFLRSFGGSRSEALMLFLDLGRCVLQTFTAAPERAARALSTFGREAESCETLDETIALFSGMVASLSTAGQDGRLCSPEVAQTMEFVKKHHREHLSLQRIARAAGLSRNYLCTLFKKETGMRLAEYLMRQRVERAKVLLKETTMKVNEVSYEVGFADESYFSRSFKRITGARPNAFRKRWVSQVDEAR